MSDLQQTVCETGYSPCDNKEVCIPNYEGNNVKCVCREGYAGKPCSKSDLAVFTVAF